MARRVRRPRPLRSGDLLVANIEGRGASAWVNVHFWFTNARGARMLRDWLTKAAAWMEEHDA